MFSWFRKKPIKKTPLELLIDKLDSIVFETSSSIYGAKYDCTLIKMYGRNIVELNNILKYVVDTLKSDRRIRRSLFEGDTHTCTLREFFIDSSGYYIDTVLYLDRFKELTKELVTILEGWDDTLEHDAQISYHRRILRPFMDTLILFIETLHKETELIV